MSKRLVVNSVKISRSKTRLTAIVMVLLLALSAALMSVPIAKAKTTISVSISWNQHVGVNSVMRFIMVLSPNILNTDPGAGDPDLVGQATIWANATLTFTRPDGTKDVVNGPFINMPNVIGGENARLYAYYTPNVPGAWKVTFYYPGDDKYNPINTTAPSSMLVISSPIPKRDVWAMLSIKPYPNVGLGQDILINAWITPPPLTDRQNYEGYVFTFTRPDGTSFTIGPMDSEGPGTVWFNLPLDTLGNWSITFDFPGDYASKPTSITRYINVQNEWIPGYPDTPLPTQPWTYPINIQNRQWRTIAGIWQGGSYNASEGSFNPYTEAPRTAHILWYIPSYGQLGGFIGSPNGIATSGGQVEYAAESATVGVYTSSTYSIRTIMAGRGYSTSGGNITCFDIHTGEVLWSRPGESFTVGTNRGRTAALYYFGSTTFIAYDAITGAILNNVTGMSVNYFVSPFAYSFQTMNSTTGAANIIKWDTSSTTTNFASRIVWNVTNPGLSYSTTAHCLIQGNLMISRHFLTTGAQLYDPDYPVNTILVDYITAVNLTTGALEYNVTTVDPADPDTWIYRQGPAWGSGEGLVYFAGYGEINEGTGYVAFNASTGKLAWWSPPTDRPWGNFWAYQPQASGYGMVFGCGYSGIWGFNATNGDILWHYIRNDTYFEEPYASNVVGSDSYPNSENLPVGATYASYSYGATGPIVGGPSLDKCVIYAVQSEHSPTLYYRGYGLQAVDASNGQELWDILGVYSLGALADGVLTMSDSINGFTYAFSKGESKTTVSTSSDVIAKGGSVLLKGTVLDMSPAQKGTAAVSDADQEAWMEYLHMQQPFPVSATGVTVSLDALDPNNNYVHIGDATTDLTGNYHFLWQPEIEGSYTVVASFYSTEAYYGSTAETSIGVTAAAPTPTPEGPAAPLPPFDMYILYATIAIIIAMAIVGILLLRKK
jgi:outer membrane protein assembly factor BamB